MHRVTDARLFRLLWLSVAAAVATISLKAIAWLLTGSVGLLSDAAESVVNLVAAVVALLALRWAVKPADDDHAYGHAKAEYFSAGVEGALILVAALVIAGVAGAALTGWDRLDPIIALAVAANILLTGSSLVRRSVGGLMDRALGEDELLTIREALAPFERDGIQFHALRTRQAGSRAFVSTHVLVPRDWSVQQGHDEAERIEAALRGAIPYATIFTHLEPIEDPRSYDDTTLDRGGPAARSPHR